MKVTIDPASGFCFGVNLAIQTAEAELDAGNVVYCLGEMVHNEEQMKQLKAKGLKVISHADLPSLEGKKVLIRAHGEPPSTFQLADKLGITLIDATCPIVTKLQDRIRESMGPDKSPDSQIVIFGKAGHAEVNGLVGNAAGKAIVIQSSEDLAAIDFLKPVRLFSQTTMNSEHYLRIGEEIEQRMKEAGNTDLFIQKSVCRQVSGRAPLLRKFASEHEVVIFVAGNNSANGVFLFSICKNVNPRSYFVTKAEEINPEWLAGSETVGVSGATSTPAWLIEQIAENIKAK